MFETLPEEISTLLKGWSCKFDFAEVMQKLF